MPHQRHLGSNVTYLLFFVYLKGILEYGLLTVFEFLLISPKVLAKHLPLTNVADCCAYLHAYSQLAHDYRDSLQQCETPVTVIVGMNSPLYHPDGQMQIAHYAQQAKVVKFHKSGHVPLTDQPIKFVRELKRFLQQ